MKFERNIHVTCCPCSKLWKRRESRNFLELPPYPRVAWLLSCSLSSPSSRSVFEAERHWSSSLSHCDIRWSSCAGDALSDFGSFPPTA
jgi:hypothetical protein